MHSFLASVYSLQESGHAASLDGRVPPPTDRERNLRRRVKRLVVSARELSMVDQLWSTDDPEHRDSSGACGAFSDVPVPAQLGGG